MPIIHWLLSDDDVRCLSPSAPLGWCGLYHTAPLGWCGLYHSQARKTHNNHNNNNIPLISSLM